jgi:hypothetical protein
LRYLNKLHGEGGSVSNLLLKEGFERLRNALAEFKLSDVYNVDETGLYYEQLPNGTYVTSEETEIRGIKTSKKRITISLCLNADGSDKFKLFFIHSALNPRCF